MTAGSPRRALTSAALAVGLATAAVTGRDTPLTAAERVRDLYDLILNASFGEAATGIGRCAPVPREACLVLEATRLWWSIQLDPPDRRLDARFARAADAAIDAAESWVARDPDRSEAWFYLGGAYGARVQWRVLRGERLAAARDGKRIKDSLERAVALEPEFDDAYFGIGLYEYYAAVAPAAAKLVRWLLLLPGGDKVNGLREMARTRERGSVLRGEADYQLHIVYLWYEKDPRRALDLLRGLERRYPRNPHFPQQIAQVLDTYMHDLAASRDAYQRLVQLAETGAINLPIFAEAQGRLGLARQLDALFETDRALAELDAVIALATNTPYAATSQAQLLRGRMLARLGRGPEATRAYRAAIAATPSDDATGIRASARSGMARSVDERAGEGYALSLEGWRAFERHELGTAVRLLTEAEARLPADMVVRYRLGHVLIESGATDRGAQEIDRVVAAPGSTPAVFYALACVDAARLAERRGDRARARTLYERAASTFGAPASTRERARADAARLKALRE